VLLPSPFVTLVFSFFAPSFGSTPAFFFPFFFFFFWASSRGDPPLHLVRGEFRPLSSSPVSVVLIGNAGVEVPPPHPPSRHPGCPFFAFFPRPPFQVAIFFPVWPQLFFSCVERSCSWGHPCRIRVPEKLVWDPPSSLRFALLFLCPGTPPCRPAVTEVIVHVQCSRPPFTVDQAPFSPLLLQIQPFSHKVLSLTHGGFFVNPGKP